jgi:hypothetical protein
MVANPEIPPLRLVLSDVITLQVEAGGFPNARSMCQVRGLPTDAVRP